MRISINHRRLLLTILCTLTVSVHAQSGRQPLDDACWDTSFEEDFDTLSLWNQTNGQGLWRSRYIWPRETIINNEQQFYIDPTEQGESPFIVDDGVLSIEAKPTPRELSSQVAGQPYISGVLTTEKSFNQQYGRFEVYAKVPAGRGLWSAFWLLPSFEQWPEGVAVLPEIDVMEHLGHQARTYHTTLHTNQTGALTSHPYEHTMKERLTDDFHLYSVVWTAESISWYLDGQWKASHPTPKDFTRPVHFLLNLAVGGNWPGSPDATTQFPAHFDIDYVKAWVDNKACS